MNNLHTYLILPAGRTWSKPRVRYGTAALIPFALLTAIPDSKSPSLPPGAQNNTYPTQVTAPAVYNRTQVASKAAGTSKHRSKAPPMPSPEPTLQLEGSDIKAILGGDSL